MKFFVSLTVLAALLILCSCNSADRLYPVTGTVKFADGTVPKGEVATIRFEPVKANPDDLGKSPAAGQLDSDGKFQMTTKELNDGVRAGNYKITLTILKTYGGNDSLVNAKYNTASTTPLECAVGPDSPKHFDFVLER